MKICSDGVTIHSTEATEKQSTMYNSKRWASNRNLQISGKKWIGIRAGIVPAQLVRFSTDTTSQNVRQQINFGFRLAKLLSFAQYCHAAGRSACGVLRTVRRWYFTISRDKFLMCYRIRIPPLLKRGNQAACAVVIGNREFLKGWKIN